MFTYLEMSLENLLSDSFDLSGQEFHCRTCGCEACRLNAGNDQANQNAQVGSAQGGGYLTTNGLISDAFSGHTANALNASGSETLEFYIHNGTGFITFDDYTYGYSLGHSSKEINFIRSIFGQVDQYIDLDFKESSDWDGTTFDIYCLDSYSQWDGATVGQVNAQGYGSSSYWDIYWLDTDGSSSLSNFDAYTIIHEIGHALGLSHPYEDPSNGNWNSDDTVMSYNASPDGYDNWFSDLDIAALIEVWGVENDNGLGLDGTYSNDVLRGSSSNDIMAGYSGHDQLTGIRGADTMFGYEGNDLIR